MRKWRLAATAAALVLATAPTMAATQKPFAYPAKHQSAEQQGSDDAQCLDWARQSTGIDPAAVAAAPAAQPGGPHGERLRGAARGAAAGAVVGELADGDSSKGAGIGATAGVLAGGARARHNQAAAAQQTQATQQQQVDTYYRAYATCMQGRGYAVG